MTTRTDCTPEDLEEAIRELNSAMYKAVQKRVQKHGRGFFVGPLEALGCITEEYHEFIGAVHSNDNDHTRQEAMDIAVGALWTWMSLKRRD